MENDLKKLILCLKWDVDNIEDLNTKRAYLSDRISDIQELVKNCNIADVVGQSEQLPQSNGDEPCEGCGLSKNLLSHFFCHNK